MYVYMYMYISIYTYTHTHLYRDRRPQNPSGEEYACQDKLPESRKFGRGCVRTKSPRARSAFKNIICGTDASQAEAFLQTGDCGGCDGFA